MSFNKRLFLPFFLIIFGFAPLSAATVSFLVIETGLDADAGVNPHSGLWESGLLDVFFEAGHIVSNAPVLRLDYMPSEVFPPEAQDDLAQALEGGVDYLVTATLEYKLQGTPAEFSPANVTFRIFKTKPFQMMFEQKTAAAIPRSSKEEFDSVKKAAQVLIPQIR
ncbi:MAG: hypothetical protein FWF29_04355 [Treponema sp.]|nr:hypothetical protein [Treponema sp.]